MRTILAIALIFYLAATQVAQSQSLTSDHAYWVIERNIHHRENAIVRFYDASDQLMHSVRIENKVINIDKRKDRRMLDALLKKYMERANSSRKKFRSRTSV